MGEAAMPKVKKRSKLNDVPVILWALIGLIVVLGIISPALVRPSHLLDFTRQAAPLIVASFGQMLVLMIAGLDLSIGTAIIFIEVMAAQTMSKSVPMGIFACMLTGIVIGLANGVMIAKLRMPAFIVTLGMSILLKGVTLIYCKGAPRGKVPNSFRFIGVGRIGPLPMALFVWIIVAILIFLLLKVFPVGRYILATGVNSNTVYQSGVNPQTVTILVYTICGALTAFAAMQVGAYVGTGVLELGTDYQMNTIAASLLGGASFNGGKGSIIGNILSAIFIIALMSLVAVLHWGAGDQEMVQGFVILAGLLVSGLRKD